MKEGAHRTLRSKGVLLCSLVRHLERPVIHRQFQFIPVNIWILIFEGNPRVSPSGVDGNIGHNHEDTEWGRGRLEGGGI